MIGVFDSGFGGLTILAELKKQLPQYDYVYLGDNANAPYGEKSQEEIRSLTRQGVQTLFEAGAEIVILGCNTASAAALRYLQQSWLKKNYPNKKILGIIVPTIEQVTGTAWRHTEPITTPISEEVFTVGVLATPATVMSGTYPEEIHKRNASVHVVQQSCAGLVDTIESGKKEKTQQLMRGCIDGLFEQAPQIQAVLLGCTHYELISQQIAGYLGHHIRLYHQPSIVAQSLQQYLARHSDIKQRLEAGGSISLYTTHEEHVYARDDFRRYLGQAFDDPRVTLKHLIVNNQKK